MQPKEHADVKIPQVGVVIVHVDHACPRQHHREEGAQLQQVEEEVDELLDGFAQEDAAVEEVAEDI